MSEGAKKVVLVGELASMEGLKAELERQGAEVGEVVPLEPKQAEDAARLRTKDDAFVYVNHLQREFLQANLVQWKAMVADEKTDAATKAELELVIGVATALDQALKAANEARCRGDFDPHKHPHRGKQRRRLQ